MYLSPPNKNWDQDYAEACEPLLHTYGKGLKLHHIGSTAVEGLFAKDCIDILGVVPDLEEVKKKTHLITGLGFVDRGEYGIKGRAYFSKTHRKIHLHIYEKNHPNVRKHLSFVMFLCDNPEWVEELNNLKQALHAQYPKDKQRYQQEKAFFYEKIHKKASLSSVFKLVN